MSDCKHCGACQNYERCNCCGACRGCGKYHAQPTYPYVIYQQPYIYTQPFTWTWGSTGMATSGNVTTITSAAS
jgi:hypothetical protein